MKTNKTSNFFLLLPFIMPFVIIVTIIGIVIIQSRTLIPHDTLNTIWKISLPDGCELIYEEATDLGFHGDRSSFRVYDSDKLLKFNQLSYNKSEEMESEFNDLINEIDVISDYLPDFEKSYSWEIKKEGMNTLFIIQSLEGKRIYLAESIM